MHPAMYWSASLGLMNDAKTNRKKPHANSAIEKGLTTQFTNSVIMSPAGFRPTFLTEEKSTFIIIGVIISHMRTAMGRFTWLPSPGSIRRIEATAAGSSLPSRIPAPMQKKTQIESRRSKNPSPHRYHGT